jgi:polyisoprenoid-binding protein YceI
MKKLIHQSKITTGLFSTLFFMAALVSAQTRGTNAGKIVIEGTSNIHDWVMTSTSGNFFANIVTDAAGIPTAISNVSFQVSVTSLKSQKGSTMDNNAYKAMAAEKYPQIRFSSSAASVKPAAGGAFTVTAPGKLSISSGEKDVTLTAVGKVNADKSITFDGSYKLTTTDYNVKAISIMLGAIKTSPDVKIVYNLTVK